MATQAEVEQIISDHGVDGVKVHDGSKPGMPFLGGRPPAGGDRMTVEIIDPDWDLILDGGKPWTLALESLDLPVPKASK